MLHVVRERRGGRSSPIVSQPIATTNNRFGVAPRRTAGVSRPVTRAPARSTDGRRRKAGRRGEVKRPSDRRRAEYVVLWTKY